MQQRVNDQAKNQPATKLTVMKESDRREPGGPGGIPLRRLGRTWIVKQFDSIQGMPECKEDDQHDRNKR